MPTGRARLLAALRWLAGPQPFATSPDSRDLGRLRELGWARDAVGRIALTDDGLTLLTALEAGTENVAALRARLSAMAAAPRRPGR